jgi:hypothetical protein
MAARVDAKLLKQTKFPSEFNQKVDMTKVNIEVMKKYVHIRNTSRQIEVISRFLTALWCSRWIAGKLSEILGSEDDVVIELCFNLLEGSRYVSWFASSKVTSFCSISYFGELSLLIFMKYLSRISNLFSFSLPASLTKTHQNSAKNCGICA